MRLRMLCTAMLVVTMGCERPAPEPTPRSPSSPQSSAAARPVGSSSAKPVAPVAAKPRCVVPLPDKPSRPPVSGVAKDCPADPTGRMQLDTTQLHFERADIAITAEVARSNPQRMRGLMYRKELRDDEGMIFMFERPSRHRFWMKNTCLPLDMMFVDAQGFIVGIEENVPTLNENSYFVRCDSQYVIEVNAGWSRKHGVKPGDRVKLPK